MRQLILGTAGHIDHGKTALVKALTGIDTDRLPAEKERGITIDIGFAHLELGQWQVGIVDVPGHERFIKNMLAGAAGIDLALLVVAADDSVMPQTLEHLAILQLLQVKQGLIALTKTDLADSDWLELVEEEVRGLVAGTFLASAPIVRTSAVSGEGVDELRSALREACERIGVPETGGCFRLAVDRSFTLPGRGTIVTGTVWSGRVAAGDEVEWQPVGKVLKVRGLQSHGRDVEQATRGQRTAVNLQGVHHTEIERGHELATPGLLRPTRRITVRLQMLKQSLRPLRHRERVRLHLGTQEVMAGVRLLEGTAVAPGETAQAQMVCAAPVVCVSGQPFVIRKESPLETLGGGTVLQPSEHRIRRRDTAAIRRLADLCAADELTRAAAAYYFGGAAAGDALDLFREAQIRREDSDRVVARLVDAGVVVELAGERTTVRLHREFLADLQARLVRTVRRLHAASPLGASVPRQRVMAMLDYLPRETVTAVLERLVAESVLVGDESRVALAEFQPKLTAGQARLREELAEAFRAAGFSPPDVAKLAASAKMKEEEVKAIAELAADEGELVHLGSGMYLHREWEGELRRRVIERLRAGEGMTVSEIRDLLGTTRRYAVPICEYLDRAGVTKREGDLRVLREP